MKNRIYYIGLLCLLIPGIGFSQCAPPSPTCAGCTALTADNQNLSTGTYCVTTTVNNLNILPGAIVCVSAPGSIVNANLSGGTLIYNGGTITNFNANSGDFRIHGTISNPTSTGFNGARVIVENGGVLNMNSLDVNWNLVVDGGTVNTTGLFRINGAGSLCMANMGQIHTQYFQNNATNGTTAQASKGCISIADAQGQTNLNNSLTNSSNVLVCLSGSSTPSNLGSAIVTTNCTNCSTALPVTYAYFRAQPLSKGIQLEWQTTNELNHSHYVVERSANAIDFFPISGPVIDPFGSRNGSKLYRFTDREVGQGTFYYRLKQVDSNGPIDYSKILAVSLDDQHSVLRLYPNPVSDQLQIRFETEHTGLIDIELSDISGKKWLTQAGNKTQTKYTQTLDVNTLPKGIYLVTIRLGNQYFIRKVVK